jgi:predicted kinase
MPKTLLIIMTGESCSGKTTLGKKIAEEFKLPFISRDEIKESLFDNLGWKDREWSHTIGIAVYDIIYYMAETLLASNVSFIIESTFKPVEQRTKELLILKNKYNYTPFQIYCTADNEILLDRFKKRNESGERHPGHVDNLNLKDFEEVLLRNEHKKLDIGGEVFDIDTSDFNAINYKNLFEAIKSATLPK